MKTLPTLQEIKIALCFDHYMGVDDLDSEDGLALLEASVARDETEFPDDIYPSEMYEHYTPEEMLDAINDMAYSVRSYLQTLFTENENE